MIIRYRVSWMTKVPFDAETEEDQFDYATWESVYFPEHQLVEARSHAQCMANSNEWGQAWLYYETGPSVSAPDWKWEIEHDSTEIFEMGSCHVPS